MSAPTLSDVTRSTSILENWGPAVARGPVARLFGGPVVGEQDLDDIQAWMTENESQASSDLAVFIRWAQEIGLDTLQPGLRLPEQYGHIPQPGSVHESDGGRSQCRAASRSGIYANGPVPTTSTRCASPKTSPRLLRGTGSRHPWEV